MAIGGDRRVLDPAGQRGPEGEPGRLPFDPRRIPWVSGTVLVLAVLIFAGELLARFPFVELFALYGPAVVPGGQWYRALSTVLVHGSIMHILFNMMVLYSIGIPFERAIGTWRFLLVSLIGALGSAVFVLWLAFDAPTVGASGMILAWAGAMLPIATREGRRQLSSWLVQIGLLSALPLLFPAIRISWQGHLGGFVFGVLAGLLLRNRARNFPTGAPILLFITAALVVVAAYAGAS